MILNQISKFIEVEQNDSPSKEKIKIQSFMQDTISCFTTLVHRTTHSSGTPPNPYQLAFNQELEHLQSVKNISPLQILPPSGDSEQNGLTMMYRSGDDSVKFLGRKT